MMEADQSRCLLSNSPIAFFVAVTRACSFSLSRVWRNGSEPLLFAAFFWRTEFSRISEMMLLISLASGLMSLGVLKKSQPADLLR